MPPGAAFPPASKTHGAHANGLPWHWATNLDVAAGMVLLLGAVVAISTLPPGSALRLALALPLVLLVPGYLLIEAVAEPAATPRARLLRIPLALGVSPALVGLLALSTAMVPGGFRPMSILVVTALACLLLGAAILCRRKAASSSPRSRPLGP